MMIFKYETLTQRQIGRLFGVSSHVIGKWLVEVGLRTADQRPTQAAHEGEFCEMAPSGTSGYHWVWCSEKAVNKLIDAGHALLVDLPPDLVSTSPLSGPFQLSTANGRDVVNCDGVVALRAASQVTAEVVLRLMNLAHQGGALDRFSNISQGRR